MAVSCWEIQGGYHHFAKIEELAVQVDITTQWPTSGPVWQHLQGYLVQWPGRDNRESLCNLVEKAIDIVVDGESCGELCRAARVNEPGTASWTVNGLSLPVSAKACRKHHTIDAHISGFDLFVWEKTIEPSHIFRISESRTAPKPAVNITLQLQLQAKFQLTVSASCDIITKWAGLPGAWRKALDQLEQFFSCFVGDDMVVRGLRNFQEHNNFDVSWKMTPRIIDAESWSVTTSVTVLVIPWKETDAESARQVPVND